MVGDRVELGNWGGGGFLVLSLVRRADLESDGLE